MKADAAVPRSSAARKTTGIQYAALPYRVSAQTLEILLITSRRTRRWIVPKGWPIEELGPADCAALEALEEAGVSGEIHTTPLGYYRYLKHFKHGMREACRVEVFALKVTRQRKTWAEKSQRERRWCTVQEAAEAVDEPLLRLMILQFEEQMSAVRPQS